MNTKKTIHQFSWMLCMLLAYSNVSYAQTAKSDAADVLPVEISSEETKATDITTIDPMALSLSQFGSDAGYPKAIASYDDFKNLVTEVEAVRESHLIDAAKFVEMAKDPKTLILDTRSAKFYKSAHVKGAVNLPFTEFTQSRLAEVIPNTETRVLIYCNNNFADDPVNFASKILLPTKNGIAAGQKPIMLALNIPTYLNLYGYGYRNIYELDELVRISSNVITIESSEDANKK